MLTVQASISNLRKVRQLSVKHGLDMDPRVEVLLNSIPRVTKLDGFNFVLKAHQAEAVAWLEKQGGTGILADEQGTGKTVSVMAYIHKTGQVPALIVVPNSLKLNWRNEILVMTGTRYRINIVGKSYSKKQLAIRTARHPNVVYSKQPTEGCDIYIINYDILSNNAERLESMNLRYMAVDESHKIKNPDAKRTMAVQRLATGQFVQRGKSGRRDTVVVGKGIGRVTMMSGTPMVNRPIELWTSVSTVAPWVPEFSKFTKFAWRYTNPVNNGHGYNFGGSANEAELNQLLTSHCMLRRLKADVLKDLPPKVFRTLPLEFDRAEYDRVENAFQGIDWKGGMEAIVRLGGNVPKSNEAIVAIQKLREIAAYAKLDSAVEWIKDYTETGDKLVVFAHNRQVIDHVKAQLELDSDYRGAVGVIYGGISDDARADAVAAFQNDSRVRVILVGITAGGFGLTLTSAKAAAFLQLPWSPGEVQQAADRVHRIGQDADQVTIFNLVAEGTVEEEMSDMIFNKGQVMDSVLDNGRTVNAVDLRIEGK